MPDALERLTALVPPPSSPVAAAGDWHDLENRLGVRLPPDFKQLIETYGAGSFDEFLWVLQPFSTNENLDLQNEWDVHLKALRILQADGYPVPFHVGSGEETLIPWAVTDNGDVCYWSVEDRERPDTWRVAVNDGRTPDWFRFNGTATEFLVEIMSKDLQVDLFPNDFPSDEPSFQILEL